MITSSQNSKIHLVRGLIARRKEREEAQAFVVEGVRLVEEALGAGWKPQFVLYSQQLSPRGHESLAAFDGQGVEVEEISEALMKAVADTEAPQGILAVLPIPQPTIPERLDFLLIADELRDPGNLGTLLRSAGAAGVQAVVLTPGTADAFNPKVVRAGMGAHFRLPIFSLDWSLIRELAQEHDLRLYLADAEGGKPAWQFNLTAPIGLVVGGEAEGASRAARAYVDGVVTIPMPGHTESLNAAIAGSILLFEVVRQRNP